MGWEFPYSPSILRAILELIFRSTVSLTWPFNLIKARSREKMKVIEQARPQEKETVVSY